LSTNDLLATENYIDVLTGRTFRQTLLVPPARGSASRRLIDRQRLENLHLIADITEVASPVPELPYCFENRHGRQLRVSREPVRKPLQLMASRRPSTSNLRQLIADLESSGERLSSQDRADIGGSLLQGALSGLFSTRTLPIEAATADAETPKAIAL